MKIGVIQASSQISKNRLLYECTKKYAKGHEVINFGCDDYDTDKYSYLEIALEAGLLLISGAVDFVITGCSSGQGMMLAMNSIPGVMCGYTPSPMDAYMYVQINNGNAVSLPLGEEYSYTGEENMAKTIEMIFKEPFGGGYPKSEAERKIKDSRVLKEIRKKSQVAEITFLKSLDEKFIDKVLSRKNVTDYIITEGRDNSATKWVREHCNELSYDELLSNVDRIHTTKLGVERICKNLKLNDACYDNMSDSELHNYIANMCKEMLLSDSAEIKKNGKNWYVRASHTDVKSGIAELTINSYNYSIITAHLYSGQY